MQIPNTMQQLLDRKALLLVCGGSSSIIYEVGNGVCELKDEITTEMLELNEDVGASAEIDKDFKGHAKSMDKTKASEYQDRSIKMTVKHVQDLDPQEIYLFCPQRISNRMVEALEQSTKAIITVARVGNYLKSHPSELLERVEVLLEPMDLPVNRVD